MFKNVHGRRQDIVHIGTSVTPQLFPEQQGWLVVPVTARFGKVNFLVIFDERWTMNELSKSFTIHRLSWSALAQYLHLKSERWQQQ
jgi:hypothetical protein